jgi:hypothetical protein
MICMPGQAPLVQSSTCSPTCRRATKRNPLVSDSAADHHRDLTVLTTAVGGELDRAVRAVNTTLGMTGKQPCNA